MRGRRVSRTVQLVRWLRTHRYRVVESGLADERAEQVVEYLNFFEFVGSLWRLGEISLRDVRMLFQYYLENIRSHDWLRRFVKKQGFESLNLLLEEVHNKGQE